jgi:hypothetical protein
MPVVLVPGAHRFIFTVFLSFFFRHIEETNTLAIRKNFFIARFGAPQKMFTCC